MHKKTCRKSLRNATRNSLDVSSTLRKKTLTCVCPLSHSFTPSAVLTRRLTPHLAFLAIKKFALMMSAHQKQIIFYCASNYQFMLIVLTLDSFFGLSWTRNYMGGKKWVKFKYFLRHFNLSLLFSLASVAWWYFLGEKQRKVMARRWRIRDNEHVVVDILRCQPKTKQVLVLLIKSAFIHF